MILYANGCSMTYGAELAGEHNDVSEPYLSPSQNQFRKKHSWPGVLADYLGAIPINSGLGGGSNDRILRSTINEVIAADLGPEDLVIIGWTETERFEYVKAGQWMQQTVNYRPDFVPEVRFVDDWARLMLSDTARVWEKFLVQVLALQHFLQARRIPYFMFNALPAVTIEDFPPIPASLNHLRSAIDESRWITKIDVSNTCMYCQIQHLPRAPSLHPLVEGHHLWGTKVYDFIQATQRMAAEAERA
jgi:hypothetical protein